MLSCKYDIEFVIPMTGRGKFANRVEFFKTAGLQNIGDKKVCVKLLTGTDNIPDIEEDWPEEVDIKVCKGVRNQIGAKIAEYYKNLTPDMVESRWSAKFDDDTVNDVSGMVENLDAYFDHTLPFYIVTELRKEIHHADQSCAESAGFSHWFRTPGKEPIHEKEGSIISATGMLNLLRNRASMKILEKRSKIEDGWGDIALAYAARAAKIYPCECDFLTCHNAIFNFSQLGGYANHIHYVAPDINKMAVDFIVGTINPPKWILDKQFLFAKVNNDHLIPIAIFKFMENGIIKPPMPNEKMWYWNGSHLLLLDQGATPTSKFVLENNDYNVLHGEFLATGQKHILRYIGNDDQLTC